jgi:hypothetical protein
MKTITRLHKVSHFWGRWRHEARIPIEGRHMGLAFYFGANGINLFHPGYNSRLMLTNV